MGRKICFETPDVDISNVVGKRLKMNSIGGNGRKIGEIDLPKIGKQLNFFNEETNE